MHLKQQGKTRARFQVKAPARTGIFLPDVIANKAGEYQLVVELKDGRFYSEHDLGKVTVFASKAQAVADQPEIEGEIGYLKEQQWVNPFAITRTQAQALRPSVPGFASVEAPADGYAVVRATSDGYYSAASILNAGQLVSAEQLLGVLVPRLGEGADIGNLLVDLEKARAQYQLASADLERLKGLYEQGAISAKRFQQAQQAFDIAKVERNTAQSRLQRGSGRSADSGIALKAPIAGELVDVTVRPGAFVRAGEALFTIADEKRRWLTVQVPEKFGQHIQKADGAWLEYQDKPLVLDSSTGAQVVKVSQQVDPKTRTVSAAIQYPSNIGPKLLGSRFAAHVYVNTAKPLLAVPASAIIDDGGEPVVYVQTGGESFTRRAVSLGLQDGDWVEITRGVAEGEWVVSSGAYYIKLASASGDAIGHGHAH